MYGTFRFKIYEAGYNVICHVFQLVSPNYSPTGHHRFFFGEAQVIPANDISARKLMEEIEKARKNIQELDWKVHDITIQPVRKFTEH